MIEEGITGIGWYNFIDESNLKSITVPKSLEGVAIYAFKNCTALTDIYYAGTESEWSSLGNFTATGNSALDTATKHYAACSHSYSLSVTQPTCTEKGYTTYTCSICGDSYTDNEVAALGHDYVAAVTEPTCTAKGHTTHTCSRCQDSYTDTETDALGHSYKATTTKATISKNGSIVKKSAHRAEQQQFTTRKQLLFPQPPTPMTARLKSQPFRLRIQQERQLLQATTLLLMQAEERTLAHTLLR